MTIQSRQGKAFDLRAQQRGVNFRLLRYGKIQIVPNPIIHHEGVVTHGEGVNPLVSAEQFDTYTVAIPKASLEDALLDYSDAIRPNSMWAVSNDEGKTWIPLRQLGDPNRISPVRIHLTLVRMGV